MEAQRLERWACRSITQVTQKKRGPASSPTIEALAQGFGLLYSVGFSRPGRSSVGQRQVCTESGKGRRKPATEPGLNLLRLDDRLAKSMGQQAVDGKDDKGHQHEGRAEPEQLRKLVTGAGPDELRQKGQEEDGQLRVQQIDQQRLGNQRSNIECRAIATHRQRGTIAPGRVSEIEQVAAPA